MYKINISAIFQKEKAAKLGEGGEKSNIGVNKSNPELIRALILCLR